MDMNLSKLAEVVWQNIATINANHDHIFIRVYFPKSISEWFSDADLTHFVANLIPMCDWDEKGILWRNDEAGYFYVVLWWSYEGESLQDYLDGQFQQSLPDELDDDGEVFFDDGELHLDQTGREKLAKLVKNSVVIKDEAVMELKIDQGLSRLFGEKALAGFIAGQFPGWEVPEVDGYTPGVTDDGAHVYSLWRSSSEEAAA